jgi:hypothetical protein
MYVETRRRCELFHTRGMEGFTPADRDSVVYQ